MALPVLSSGIVSTALAGAAGSRSYYSPINDGAVVLVVLLAVLPVVIDLVRERFLIQFDAEPWPCRQIEIAFPERERLLEIAFAQRHLLLAEKVRNRGGQLHAGRQRDRSEGIVRR